MSLLPLEILHYILWNGNDCREDYIAFTIGILLASPYIYYSNVLLYRVNPEYNLHGSNSFSISLQAFEKNMGSLGTLFRSFSIIGADGIPISLPFIVLTLLITAAVFKKWKEFLISISAVLGTFLFLALPKTLDYRSTLMFLFSQTRMFLFVPYVILVVGYYVNDMFDNAKVVQYWHKNLKLFVILMIIICAGKITYFYRTVVYDERLYQDSVVSVKNTSMIYDMAGSIRDEIKKLGG